MLLVTGDEVERCETQLKGLNVWGNSFDFFSFTINRMNS
jgi:hypothetical protein